MARLTVVPQQSTELSKHRGISDKSLARWAHPLANPLPAAVPPAPDGSRHHLTSSRILHHLAVHKPHGARPPRLSFNPLSSLISLGPKDTAHKGAISSTTPRSPCLDPCKEAGRTCLIGPEVFPCDRLGHECGCDAGPLTCASRYPTTASRNPLNPSSKRRLCHVREGAVSARATKPGVSRTSDEHDWYM